MEQPPSSVPLSSAIPAAPNLVVALTKKRSVAKKPGCERKWSELEGKVLSMLHHLQDERLKKKRAPHAQHRKGSSATNANGRKQRPSLTGGDELNCSASVTRENKELPQLRSHRLPTRKASRTSDGGEGPKGSFRCTSRGWLPAIPVAAEPEVKNRIAIEEQIGLKREERMTQIKAPTSGIQPKRHSSVAPFLIHKCDAPTVDVAHGREGNSASRRETSTVTTVGVASPSLTEHSSIPNVSRKSPSLEGAPNAESAINAEGAMDAGGAIDLRHRIMEMSEEPVSEPTTVDRITKLVLRGWTLNNVIDDTSLMSAAQRTAGQLNNLFTAYGSGLQQLVQGYCGDADDIGLSTLTSILQLGGILTMTPASSEVQADNVSRLIDTTNEVLIAKHSDRKLGRQDFSMMLALIASQRGAAAVKNCVSAAPVESDLSFFTIQTLTSMLAEGLCSKESSGEGNTVERRIRCSFSDNPLNVHGSPVRAMIMSRDGPVQRSGPMAFASKLVGSPSFARRMKNLEHSLEKPNTSVLTPIPPVTHNQERPKYARHKQEVDKKQIDAHAQVASAAGRWQKRATAVISLLGALIAHVDSHHSKAATEELKSICSAARVPAVTGLRFLTSGDSVTLMSWFRANLDLADPCADSWEQRLRLVTFLWGRRKQITRACETEEELPRTVLPIGSSAALEKGGGDDLPVPSHADAMLYRQFFGSGGFTLVGSH